MHTTRAPSPPALAPPALALPQPAARRVIAALILREIAARHGRLPGGYLWALIEPAAVVALLALAFSLMLHTPALGTSFLLFYATGYLPFRTWHTVARLTASAPRMARGLLAYPAVAPIDAIAATALLQVLTMAVVNAALLGAVIAHEAPGQALAPGLMLGAFGLAAGLGVATGLFNAVAFALVPVWRTLFDLLSRPLLLASGVLFLPEDLPPRLAAWLWANPLLHITALMRAGSYPYYTASFATPAYPAFAALVLALAGLLALRRARRLPDFG